MVLGALTIIGGAYHYRDRFPTEHQVGSICPRRFLLTWHTFRPRGGSIVCLLHKAIKRDSES